MPPTLTGLSPYFVDCCIQLHLLSTPASVPHTPEGVPVEPDV
jgi:hypothetical protein